MWISAPLFGRGSGYRIGTRVGGGFITFLLAISFLWLVLKLALILAAVVWLAGCLQLALTAAVVERYSKRRYIAMTFFAVILGTVWFVEGNLSAAAFLTYERARDGMTGQPLTVGGGPE